MIGHIRGAISLRLSSLMTRRLSKGKIGVVDLITDQQRGTFLSRDPEALVIVYDENSSHEPPLKENPKDPLLLIMAALVREKIPCGFLDGPSSVQRDCCTP